MRLHVPGHLQIAINALVASGTPVNVSIYAESEEGVAAALDGQRSSEGYAVTLGKPYCQRYRSTVSLQDAIEQAVAVTRGADGISGILKIE